jgi:hypothetical protein
LLFRADFFFFLTSFLNPSYLIFSLWMKLCTLYVFLCLQSVFSRYVCKAVVIPFVFVFQRTPRNIVYPQCHREDSQLQFRVGLFHFYCIILIFALGYTHFL